MREQSAIVQTVFDFAIREINALEQRIITAEDDADAMLWEQAQRPGTGRYRTRRLVVAVSTRGRLDGELMLYVDDRLPTHPKILKAGARLGEGGASQALHLYLLGLAYARQNLTDGFVPESFVIACGAIPKSGSIAKVLANRTIRLWRKVKGGYQIHDFHKYNPKASEVKEKREYDRQRKAEERSRRNGHVSTMDISRTRGRAVPVPSTKYQKKKRTSTDAPRRFEILHPVENPSFALSCVVMREALDQAATVDHDTSLATAGEYFKTFCAHRGLAYDADLVRKAYDACAVAAVVRKRA